MNAGEAELVGGGGGATALLAGVDGALLGRDVIAELLGDDVCDELDVFDGDFELCDVDAVLALVDSELEPVGDPVGDGVPGADVALSDGVPAAAPAAPFAVVEPAAAGPVAGWPDPPSTLYAATPTTATPARIAPIFSARGGRFPPRCRPQSASSWKCPCSPGAAFSWSGWCSG